MKPDELGRPLASFPLKYGLVRILLRLDVYLVHDINTNTTSDEVFLVVPKI